MKFAVIVFPGSNCDADCFHAIEGLGQPVRYVWHKETSLKGIDCVILPGGFSFGDYLRCGAIAKQSPIMNEVRRFANSGRPVIGICNGFQILTEAGLLPGALISNASLQFVCKDVHLRVANTRTPFTQLFRNGDTVRMPIAHHDGNFVASPEVLREIEGEGQIVFQYADATGRVSEEANPNGSMKNIAGIVNRSRNVLGMMPHPDRCADPILGNAIGKRIFEGLLGEVAA